MPQAKDDFKTARIGDQVDAAMAAMATQKEFLQLEDGLGMESDLWHLLRSLIVMCDAVSPRIDFDKVLSEVRQDILELGA